MYAEFTKKKVFVLTVGAGSLVRPCHGRQKVSIPDCDLTGRRSTITLLPVRLHSGIINSSYTNNVLSVCVHV